MTKSKFFARPGSTRTLVFALGLAFAGGVATAQTPTVASYDNARAAEAAINVGKSQIIELPVAYEDVMIVDTRIADVLPLSPKSVYVVGKSIGSTALTLYGPGRRLIAAVNIVVTGDTEGLKARLRELLPSETNITVHAANQSIVLAGTVSSPAILQRAVALAESYAPGKVVNMLGVEGTQQVMLSVRFVEMQRSLAKDLRLNVQRPTPNSGADPNLQITTGDTVNRNTNLLSGTFASVMLKTSWNGDLNVLFDALETRGLAKTLAEPNLVAMSGDTANFLAGGEFPIPVQQTSVSTGGSPAVTIEYKQFGVALAFTPTILRDGLINLVVNPEVSSIDTNASVTLGSVRVPGIKVRRAHTTVELRDGESFTVAGLLRDDYVGQIRQFPFLGDIPVLGALFRSNGYQRDETELVIVVTPHLVTPRRGPIATPADGFTPPSDMELFLRGNQSGSKTSGPANSAAAPAASGHVLQ